MPRRNHTRRDGRRPERPPGGGLHQHQEAGDGTWTVRAVTGAAATKVYRCPGCDHEIMIGVPHVVVWPAHGTVEERRHWHRTCWDNRTRRRITRREGR